MGRDTGRGSEGGAGLFLVDPGRGIAETEKRERLCLGWPRIVLAVRVVHVHVLRLDHWTGIGCEVARVGASYISYMAFAGSDTDISSGERVHGDTGGSLAWAVSAVEAGVLDLGRGGMEGRWTEGSAESGTTSEELECEGRSIYALQQGTITPVSRSENEGDRIQSRKIWGTSAEQAPCRCPGRLGVLRRLRRRGAYGSLAGLAARGPQREQRTTEDQSHPCAEAWPTRTRAGVCRCLRSGVTRRRDACLFPEAVRKTGTRPRVRTTPSMRSDATSDRAVPVQ